MALLTVPKILLEVGYGVLPKSREFWLLETYSIEPYEMQLYAVSLSILHPLSSFIVSACA